MTIEEQIKEIEDTAARFAAASRLNIPVPIAEWKDLMTSRIGAASVKTAKSGKQTIKPVEKGVSVSRQIGRKAKADRLEYAWKALGPDSKTPATKNAHAHAAGHAAHAKGKSINDCPHDGRTLLAKEWKRGFEAAAKEARKAARKAKAA